MANEIKLEWGMNTLYFDEKGGAIGFPTEQNNPVLAAARKLGATPAPGIIGGLWNAPGYPELTTSQLLDIASRL